MNKLSLILLYTIVLFQLPYLYAEGIYDIIDDDDDDYDEWMSDLDIKKHNNFVYQIRS